MWLSWWRIHLQCGRPGFDPLFGKIWRRERLPTPVFWPGEFHGQPMGSQRVGHSWATFTLLHFTVNKLSAYIDWILFPTNGRNYLVHMYMFLNCVFLLFLMLTKIFVLLFWILSFLSQATWKMVTVKESPVKWET